jgi:hypothetical protein
MAFDGRYQLIVGEELPTVRGLPPDCRSPRVFDFGTDPEETTDVAETEPAVVERLADHLPASTTGP